MTRERDGSGDMTDAPDRTSTERRGIAMSREPCLICCSESEIPASLRDFVLEVRAEYPASVLQERSRPCWNCRGTGTVETPPMAPREG